MGIGGVEGAPERQRVDNAGDLARDTTTRPARRRLGVRRFAKAFFEVAGNRLGIVVRQHGAQERRLPKRGGVASGRIYPFAVFSRDVSPLAIRRSDSYTCASARSPAGSTV